MPEQPTTTERLVVLGCSVVAGLLAGGALALLTALVARAGPQGDHWSFRGNGALVVPFGVGPAVVAGGWVALARRARGDARWRAWGLAAGGVGVALVVASVAALALAGPAGQRASAWLSGAPLAWLAAAPLLAAALPAAGRPSARAPGAHLAAALLFAAALATGFAAAAWLVPPG